MFLSTIAVLPLLDEAGRLDDRTGDRHNAFYSFWDSRWFSSILLVYFLLLMNKNV